MINFSHDEGDKQVIEIAFHMMKEISRLLK